MLPISSTGETKWHPAQQGNKSMSSKCSLLTDIFKFPILSESDPFSRAIEQCFSFFFLKKFLSCDPNYFLFCLQWGLYPLLFSFTVMKYLTRVYLAQGGWGDMIQHRGKPWSKGFRRLVTLPRWSGGRVGTYHVLLFSQSKSLSLE